MSVARRVRSTFRRISATLRGAATYDCPCCGWHGVFLDVAPPTGARQAAECPRCSALERHRFQSLVLDQLLPRFPVTQMRMLHFAPEPFFRKRFSTSFAGYETADIDRADVDHRVDLQHLPFADASYDLVYASHVMEHIPDDAAAIREVVRILRPGGVAVLPVPIVAERTIEYDKPNPLESMHVRAPGPDYFDRYRAAFARVDVYESTDFPERFQPSVLTREGRTADYVPVCFT